MAHIRQSGLDFEVTILKTFPGLKDTLNVFKNTLKGLKNTLNGFRDYKLEVSSDADLVEVNGEKREVGDCARIWHIQDSQRGSPRHLREIETEIE